MNDSILKQLKIMVERIVRPIRASTAAKRAIQEELLAHVVDVFEEEVSRLADERAALIRTEQRFGNSSELTDQRPDSITIGGNAPWIVDQLWLRLAR